MKKKVYISSTFKDLKDYRATLITLFQNQLQNSFELSNIMEKMYDKGTHTPFVEDCVAAVKSSDIYIIILGNKVGSYPPNEKRTYTEIELDTALNSKKLLFFIKLKAFDPKEIDDATKHNELLQKFEGKPSHTFTNETELENEILKCLVPHIPQKVEKNLTPAKLLSPNGSENPTVFLGREDELRTIRERLDKCGKLMLINAEGGIGKTTLAAKYWNESLYNYKHNAWLFCENGIVNALKELAPKLNVDLAGMNEAQQVAALKHALSQVHDDFLLVLDNANDEKEIKVFKQHFEGFHWHVLITSRCHKVLEPEQEYEIKHLPPPIAKALFEKYYKEPSPDFDNLLDRLLKAINYHTLLVEIFAKNIKAAKSITTMQEFLEKLEAGGLHLAAGDSFEIQTVYTSYVKKEAADTDAILDILYDFTKLDETHRNALLNLAFLPAEAYPIAYFYKIFGKTDKEEKKAYKAMLTELHKKGWLNEEDDIYRLSPVIQKLALEKNTKTLEQDALPLLDRLKAILETDAYNLKHISLTEAQDYVKPIFHLTKCLQNHPSWDIASYNFRAGIYFKNIGDIVSTKACYTNYGEIHKTLLIEDSENLSYKHGLAVAYSKLGEIYMMLGDGKNAMFYHKEENDSFKEIYESSPENLSYKNGLAISYEKLGGIYEATGDWQNALINYQERNRISKEIYASSPENLSYKNGLAISYSKLGGIYEATGDWQNALINYQEDFRITKEIYESSPENLSYKNGLAISFEKLGIVYEATGDLKNAATNFQEKYRISKEICETSPENLEYKHNLALSYYYLGKLLEKDNLSEAISNLKISVKLYEEINEIAPEIVNYAKNLRVIKNYLEELMSKSEI